MLCNAGVPDFRLLVVLAKLPCTRSLCMLCYCKTSTYMFKGFRIILAMHDTHVANKQPSEMSSGVQAQQSWFRAL